MAKLVLIVSLFLCLGARASEPSRYELPFKLGQTDCLKAREKIQKINLELCRSQTNYLTPPGTWGGPDSLPHEISKSGPDLCADHMNHRFDAALGRFKKFRQIPELCSRVAYRVNDWIKLAYELELKGPVEFKKEESCPLVLTFEDEILEPERAPATLPFACYEGKLALYARRITEKPAIILADLEKRFGKAERVTVQSEGATSLPSRKPIEIFRKTHFFNGPGMHALLVSFSKGPIKTVTKPNYLEDSFVLFFTEDYLKVHLADYTAMKTKSEEP